jgi:hypothetical protein
MMLMLALYPTMWQKKFHPPSIRVRWFYQPHRVSLNLHNTIITSIGDEDMMVNYFYVALIGLHGLGS